MWEAGATNWEIFEAQMTDLVETIGVGCLGDVAIFGKAGAAAAVSRTGGIKNVLKGTKGVNWVKNEINSMGGRVIGEETTLISANGWWTRPDLYVELPNGTRGFIEVKNGLRARLRLNQRMAYPSIRSRGAIAIGPNASAAGLSGWIPPTPVWVINI
jgi:hypothetical protein